MELQAYQKRKIGLRRLGYIFIKYWISFGLFCYYEKIKVVGLGNVPTDKPVLFLSNHQSALMDVLLIATRCNRKPWFLTRADVFTTPILKWLFEFLQMLPIYRIRDGKDSLFKNLAIFNRCGQLMTANEAILLFPEANHHLERRVRPLSKGFTRIIFNALDKDPTLDIQLVPVGQNYQDATAFPDRAALYFGKPIAVQQLLQTETRDSVQKIKETVADRLKHLTTHIADRDSYGAIVKRLDALGADYTNPVEMNSLLLKLPLGENALNGNPPNRLKKWLVYLINLPMVLLWRIFAKPRVPEDEFMGTFRFGFILLCYPFFYVILFLVLSYAFEWRTACLSVVGHAALNMFLVKWPTITSSGQRK